MSAAIDVEEVLSRTPLASVVGRNVTLKRNGRLLKGCCPFHAEKTPSFTVYNDGHFHCFGCGEHGNAIDYTAKTQGLTFAEALQKLAGEAGITDRATETQAQRRKREQIERDHARREAARVAKEARDRESYVGWVGKRVRQTVPVGGTLGEQYLLATRGIPKPLAGWPDSVRFDPKETAVVFVTTDATGKVRGGQWVYLTDGAAKAAPTDDRPSKRSRGEVRGIAVRLPGHAGGSLLVAEGPETGLSVWAATGCETWVALGGIAGLATPPTGRDIVACLDDDRRHSAAARRARDTVARWRRSGLPTVTAKPWEIRREDSSDFNDLLREKGSGAVEARILEALEPLFFASGRKPASAPPAHGPVGLAESDFALSDIEKRARLRQSSAQTQADDDDNGSDIRVPDAVPIPVGIGRIRLNRFALAEIERIKAAPLGDFGVVAIGAGAGIGKTQELIEAAVVIIRWLREHGDDRTVVITTPRLDLADEQVTRLRREGIRVAVYRGADAIDPETGLPMCRNNEARRAAEMRRLDPKATVCPKCPFNAGCAKLAQDDVRADIWLSAHNLIFLRKPKALGVIAWEIIDENPLNAALIGVGDPRSDDDDKPVLLDEDVLRSPSNIIGDQDRTDRLHQIRSRESILLETSELGRVNRNAVISAGLTGDMLEEAIKLEYATIADPGITADMPLADRLAAMREVDDNMQVGKRVMLHRSLLTLLRRSPRREESGHVEIVAFKESGRSVLAFAMKGVRAIRDGWKVPTTIIDATIQPELLRHVWPGMRVNKIAQIAAPHRHIRQVVDRAFSLSALDADSPYIDSKERNRRQAGLKKVHVIVAREARRCAPGRVLIVAQKRVRTKLQALGKFGDNVVFAHHGAITGRDEWKDVRAVIVLGRTMPPPAAVERMAEALTGVPVSQSLDGKWYPRRDATHLMSDGRLVATETDFHPDPTAEAFRWRACEGELVQIIDRARGVNRQSDNERVDVLLLTDVPLPMPIDELLTAEELTPRVEDRMLLEGGVAFQNAQAAAVAYPGEFPSGGNLRVQRWREKERFGSWWEPYPWLEKWRFQKKASGSRHEYAYVDRTRIADPFAHLTATLGELTYCVLIAALQPPQDQSSKGDETQPTPRMRQSQAVGTTEPQVWTNWAATGREPDAKAADG
jgi:putative DNA primase/helicase